MQDFSQIRSIAMVCMGNICRSPIAEHVMRAKVNEAGLAIDIVSAGTGGWHAGEPADYRAANVLDQFGYTNNHIAQQFKSSWFDLHDLILVMDEDNLHAVHSLTDQQHHKNKVHLIRSFDDTAKPGAVVPDPYYGNDDGFINVIRMIERACDGLIQRIISA
jgi:protein-tyrosine phosphatase